MRRRLEAVLRESSAADAARLLGVCSVWLLEARASFSQAPALPCGLDLIGELRNRPAYIGLLPPPSWKAAPEAIAITDAALLQRELRPLIEATRAERRWPEDALLGALALPALESSRSLALAEALTSILASA